MTTYRVWPATDGPAADVGDHSAYSMGLMIYPSGPLYVTAIYWWRATTSSPAPTECAVYDVASKSPMATPTPFADPGSQVGWLRQQLDTPVPIDAATPVKVVVFGNPLGYSGSGGYWESGDGASGIVNGPLKAFNSPDARFDDGGVGQCSFHSGASIAYPDNFFNDTNYWLDVEVADTIAPPAFDLDATFTGTGALDVALTPAVALAATFGGTGTATVTASPSVPLTPGYGGTGALSVPLAPSVAVVSHFTGTGVLSVSLTEPEVPVELIVDVSVPAQAPAYRVAATPRASHTVTIGEQP